MPLNSRNNNLYPEEWPAFESYLHDIKLLKTYFTSSTIIHVPRTENQKADSLARCVRKQSSFVVHMDCGVTSLVRRIYMSLFVDDKKKIIIIYTILYILFIRHGLHP